MAYVTEFYRTNKDFKEWVDKYAKKHRMLPENCFNHALVIETYLYYKRIEEQENENRR